MNPKKQVPLAAYSVAEFCSAYGLTKVTLYKLWKQNEGPRFCKVGRRTLITIEAATDWHRHLEASRAKTALEGSN